MNRKLLRMLALLLCGLLTGTCVACQLAGPDTPGTDVPTDPAFGTDTEPDTEPETAPPPASVSAQAVSDALLATRYQVGFEAFDPCGLSDPSAVGINETEFNTVLYPAPADDTCRKVVHAAEYDIRPENDDNSKAFDKMMNDLADAVGRVKIVFAPGVYRFSSTLRITGRSRLCLCSETPGTPFTILMTEWTPGIRITDSNDIQFVDVEFDYETPSAVSGTVVSAAPQKVVIRVDDAFDLSDRRYGGGNINYGSYMEMKKDEETGDYVPDLDANLLYNSTGDHVKNIESGSWNADKHELTLNFLNPIKPPETGRVVCVAFTMYEYFGMQAEGCKNIRLESMHFCHTAGMAVGMTGCENIYLNRVFLSPREGSPMLMTATADGFHCINCTGEIMVTSCVFEKSHDDSMNINGRYLSVTGADANSITVEALVVPVREGDVLELLSKNDLHVVGTVTVKSVKGNTITCDGASADMKNCFAGNVTTSPTLTIRNCFFGNKRNRGILVQVRRVLIENCVFRQIAHGAIQIFTVPSSFGEGICPQDVTVRNCKFISCNSTDVNLFSWAASGAMAAGVVRDVTISNNYFNASGYYPVQVSTGGNVQVDHNLFDSVCTNGTGFTSRSVIRVTCSRDVTVSDNAILSLPKRFSFTNERDLIRDKQSENVVFERNTELS